MWKIKKYFGEFNMTWLKVILLAIFTAVYTALINQVSFMKDTSFQDIAIYVDWWILFAVFIIVNCEKWWEASLKCFVFFLISQPLIYLIAVMSVSINLQKGQRIDLTKGNAGLNKILVGLGWDPVETKSSGGFLSGLFGGGGSTSPNIDCDASVLMLKNDKIVANSDVIYFGNLKSANGAVAHSGDNLTGAGDGDDEQIVVELNSIPAEFNRLVFVVNIYDAAKRKQHFGMIQNAFIRIVNGTTNQELLKYNLSDNYSNQTTLITGELYRHENEWKFAAIGTGTQDVSLGEVIGKYK